MRGRRAAPAHRPGADLTIEIGSGRIVANEEFSGSGAVRRLVGAVRHRAAYWASIAGLLRCLSPLAVAAAVGLPHPKWEERPLLVIEALAEHAPTRDEVLQYLAPRIVKWWMPDDVVFAPVPLTATGKIDKKLLRERYRDHLSRA